ncbi:MAG TPA: transcriptional regulator NrdR [Phycisphaerales bacterium]|nr:transcriptional regulator NrdR [Phycisphaerales bacterium]|tara:strand:+ start:1163 stop:1657 length:495 start_codon:yes stop_codon:yes gene_type:complete
MRCPYCNSKDNKVIDSRAADGGDSIRRRRECLKCARRFTTREHVEQRARLVVIKKDGTRVPFDRQKIQTGLEKSCYKRPIATETLQELVDRVEEELHRKYEREVEAIVIGKTVAEYLKQLDQIAYVRFASVYKQFRDLDDFLAEVKEVLDTNKKDDPKNQGTLF